MTLPVAFSQPPQLATAIATAPALRVALTNERRWQEASTFRHEAATTTPASNAVEFNDRVSRGRAGEQPLPKHALNPPRSPYGPSMIHHEHGSVIAWLVQASPERSAPDHEAASACCLELSRL